MAKAKRANFGGRPKREPMPGERVPMSFRVTPELKARIDRAAEHSGRSVSLEMELRLEQSFEKETRLGGPDLSNIATLMLAAFWHAGSQYARSNDRPELAEAMAQRPVVLR